LSPWPSTLRWRLTLWYTVLLAAPLIVLAVGYYLLFARTLAARTDKFIGDALTAFSRELVAERRAALGVIPAVRTTVDEVRFRDLHIAVLDAGDAVVAMTPMPAAEMRPGRTPEEDFDAWVGGALRRQVPGDTVATTVSGRVADYRVVVRRMSLADQRLQLAGTYSLADDVYEEARRALACRTVSVGVEPAA